MCVKHLLTVTVHVVDHRAKNGIEVSFVLEKLRQYLRLIAFLFIVGHMLVCVCPMQRLDRHTQTWIRPLALHKTSAHFVEWEEWQNVYKPLWVYLSVSPARRLAPNGRPKAGNRTRTSILALYMIGQIWISWVSDKSLFILLRPCSASCVGTVAIFHYWD